MQLHGARSGPAAMALFSCNGRPDLVEPTLQVGPDSDDPDAADSSLPTTEAGILDKVSHDSCHVIVT
jgi:hypothetical protein